MQGTVALPSNRAFAETLGHQYRWYVVLAAFATIAHLPLLAPFAWRLWSTAHYQHFPVILVAAAYLAYRRIRDESGVVLIPGHAVLRVGLWTVAVTILAGAVLLHSPWFAAISGLVWLLVGVYSLGGRSLVRTVLPAWIFLWLVIPLPLRLDSQLIHGLQLVATTWASSLLDLMNVQHLVHGNLIRLPGQTFEVERACSGVQSLYAALSCAIFIMIVSRRGVIRTILLVLATVFWVLVANAFRVVAVTVLTARWGIPISEGIAHDVFGACVFIALLGLIFSTDRLLLYLVPPEVSLRDVWRQMVKWRKWPLISRLIPDGRVNGESRGSANPAAAASAAAQPAGAPVARAPAAGHGLLRAETLVLAAILAVLITVQVLEAQSMDLRPAGAAGSMARLTEDDAALLPSEFNGWRQVNYQNVQRASDDRNGRYSRQWWFRNGDRSVLVAMDGPFFGWHNLASCLVGQGWQIEQTSHVAYEDLGEPRPGGFTELVASQGPGRRAWALFAIFDDEQRPYQPPTGYVSQVLSRFSQGAGLRDAITFRRRHELGRSENKSYQIQVFAEQHVPMSDDELDELRELFQHMRRVIVERS